ncbi:MAG: ABC transporter substrate-binding protein, partial [Actinobacteria bacterium]|nr:ABC transporter substrate-binding protein [Actinomycetota bacterium]
MIKEDLDKIGIKLGIFNEPSEEWYPDYVLSGNYELGVLSIKNFDGSNLNSNFSSDKLPSLATEENKNCLNFYWYKNSDADEILKKVINESDAEKRKELFQNLQDILAQDAVILPLYNKLFAIAYNNKKIKNVDFSIKNNKIFFDIENWILSNKEEESEDKINEIIIGYKGEYCKLSNLLNMDYINSLVLKGLWEINEKGEYESVLVEEEYVSYDYITTSMPTLKRKITLKDNIFWEDGTPITSGDVKYTYDAILEDGIIINIDEDYSRIEEIEIINEKEFNIVFKENVKDWKKLFSVILKDGLLEGKDINNFSVKSIISNGPYKVGECVDGEYLLLKKNEFYLGELSEIDSIKILFDTDINNLISMFIDGEVDLLEIPADLDLMKNLEEDEDFDLLVKPNNVLEHLVICLKPVEG